MPAVDLGLEPHKHTPRVQLIAVKNNLSGTTWHELTYTSNLVAKIKNKFCIMRADNINMLEVGFCK